MKLKIFLRGFIVVSIFLSLINAAAAQSEVINLDNLKSVAIPIHVIEIVFALFICYMALTFFRITKPLDLFMYIYTAIGFFIINSLLYLFLYLSIKTQLEINFINVYIGSRIALMGMLISFALFFYQWNRIMRKTEAK
ncbi:hypothetical protein CMO93_03425 [Candidatus Woesearchaeota archaeon]|nr:hypothetical protein [Candidatus Woesearchaeota archaeon]|tara:strand:- start:1531 stop:1944 length:414 start_codon:yes stop_codon:yes gene_type:complete